MGIQNPADIHQAVQERLNAGDVDGLVALYEPDARMVGSEGEIYDGLSAIRDNWARLADLGVKIELATTYVVEAGDLALLRNDYTVQIDGTPVGASGTAEVVRRQPDGTWLYIIDHPFGAAVGDASATSG
jgi:ketosteroid isomerase-like protein